MARLNEAPAPALETLDALKRKWTRQNREIVRINTAQSSRIRNLECEITRLLNENLQWREEAISARAEAEKLKAAHKLSKEVLRMKEQLEQKLSEVGELVGELGSLPERVARRSSQRRRKDGFVSDMLKKPEAREPRQRQTMLEQEGRLPAIVEDKHYPRRTLESNEISALRDEATNNATESPELGPPPVAHFDEAEAVAFETARSHRRTSTELMEETERSSCASMTGLENRRKRRTSTLLQTSDLETSTLDALDVQNAAVESEPEPEKKQTSCQPHSILKKGAKRKLEVSELEDTSSVSKQLDDFIFQRRAVAPSATARPSRFSRPTARDNQENHQSSSGRSPEKCTQTNRRILAPKMANSPAKRRINDDSGKADVQPVDGDPQRPGRRTVSRIRTRPATTELQLNEDRDQPVSETATVERPQMPKTPAAELDDILSPISTEPSTKQRLPKEAAVSNSVEDVLNGSIGRGSRRARAAVSYAEPNLRDKMRRPGKELVSAVEGLSRQIGESERGRGKSASLGIELKTEGSHHTTVKERDDALERQEQSRMNASESARVGKSEPGSLLLDKVAASLRKKSVGEENKRDSKTVFDPPTSSPTDPGLDATATGRPRGSQQMLKSRRHSAQPASTQQVEDLSGSNSSSALRSRRLNSQSDVKQDAAFADVTQDEHRSNVRRAASVATLPTTSISERETSTSVCASSNHVGSDTDDQRLPRGGLSRRRSLMV